MDYNFKEIEQKWQKYWVENKTYKVTEDPDKEKFYVLDMFPYPSGAGLHVGHPLGYIASDIFSRFMRMKGKNVLHPMGYDAYGLPAEQYAIQTGQHPAITTENNIKRYREQLDRIGFSYDWSREVKTCDPDYYKWTQWAFIEMFNHWYNHKTQKAEPIETLTAHFAKEGNENVQAACNEPPVFSAEEWNEMTEEEQQKILLHYRLAYLADAIVNWCPELGTVLANDEVKDGLSVRGGHPVEQRKMKQWLLRVSAYAQRLLEGLNHIEWSDSLKEIQRNWIGRSEGAEILFPVLNQDKQIEVFTTRPDTIFGSTFMVLAPESELVPQFTSPDQEKEVESYIQQAKKRSERDRMAETKSVTGVFTGSYAINPFTKKEIPIWISDYVLAGYGTGAIMAVPAHDSRDYLFAKTFDIEITQVVSGGDISKESYDAKEGKLMNSGFLNGKDVQEAIPSIIDEIEKTGIGKRKINYRLRDAIFSRQRYWGEPFPIYYKNGLPYPLPKDKLPLTLPDVDAYLPTGKGEPPLGRAKDWATEEGYPLELSTMPGFAGSSAYYLRYMDPHNNEALVSKKDNAYWRDVDLYIGGTEHATGHLVYSRFWCKFLYDIGAVVTDEPFRKLINQGMIQGRSNFVYRVKNSNTFVTYDKRKEYEVTPIHVDVNIVSNDILDIEAFKKWNPDYASAEFVLSDDGTYKCGYAVEKMSKSLYNVVNPDQVIEDYGADTLRMYEMFLGPIEQAKPWDTNGIDGVHKFFRKVWRLFHDEDGKVAVSNTKPTGEELKTLHKTIKKITEDIQRFSFNTSVSAFMICVNELTDQKCDKQDILNPFTRLLAPFAPHVAEELWSILGNSGSIVTAIFPEHNEEYLAENTHEYPVSFNGKMRFKMELPIDMDRKEMEKTVLSSEQAQKWTEGKMPKKIIIVPGKIINIVI